MYKIIALIGEAGSGKDTIMQSVLAHYPGMFNEIISCTTRPMRENEVDGVNYYFLNAEQFATKIFEDQMLEASVFRDWCYGTSKEALRQDMLNIGVFNPDGIRVLLEHPEVELKVFKIICDDKTRLLRQLNREQDPDVNEIIRRFIADKEAFDDLEFDYIKVPNEIYEDLKMAGEQIINQLELTC